MLFDEERKKNTIQDTILMSASADVDVILILFFHKYFSRKWSNAHALTLVTLRNFFHLELKGIKLRRD